MSKTAVYRTVVAMLRENNMSPTDFVAEHLKTLEAKVIIAEAKRKEAEDTLFNKGAASD